MTVYCVPAESAAAGTNVAVSLRTTTVPGTDAPPMVLETVKLAAFKEETCINSEKVADIDELVATPTSLLDGEVSDTVGRP